MACLLTTGGFMNAIIGFIKPGIGELLIIFLIVLLLFGAKRLPQIGASIGQAIKGFRKSLQDKDKDESDHQ